MRERLVHAICGTCLHRARATAVPSACFSCGAHYNTGAPLVLFWLVREPKALRFSLRREWLGDWPADIRAQVERSRFHVIE